MTKLFRLAQRRISFSKTSKWLTASCLAVLVSGCGEAVVDAPPAKVTFENSWFRILDLNLPPGTTLTHTYSNDVGTIVIGGSDKVRAHAPGADWGAETAANVGDAYVGEPGEHGIQNRGAAPLQLFALENLREPAASKPEPVTGTGVKLAAESAALGAYDIQLAENNFQVSHAHTVPTVVVLVKGRILSQGPESKDPAIGAAPTGLKQLDQSGQWVLIPAGEPHFIVRLGADPSHVAELELR
jgi:hypothetical protein